MQSLSSESGLWTSWIAMHGGFGDRLGSFDLRDIPVQRAIRAVLRLGLAVAIYVLDVWS